MNNNWSNSLHKQGFTLIEILVVVLIIAILAAVALPQYQKAVAKTRLAQAIFVARIIKNAQELYYLTHGEYADTMEELDIEVQPPQNTSVIVHTNTDRVGIATTNENDPYSMDIVYSLDHGYNETLDTYKGALYCAAKNSKPKAVELCKSYTGVEVEVSSSHNRWRIN